MIDTTKFGESALQKYRFRKALPYLDGDVMDFGGNNGELRPFVRGDYLLVNYDHSVMGHRTFDTVVALAVVEHIAVDEVYTAFREIASDHLRPGGCFILTTPTPASKPVLELLSRIGIIGRENIEEHKHYWDQEDIESLARHIGVNVERYEKFQLGFNQLAIFRKPVKS